MATDKKTKTAAKGVKSAGGNKFVKALVAIPLRIWTSIQNTVAELKKVTWPTLKDLRNYATIVVIFMVLMAVVVGLLDLSATRLVSLIIQRA